MQPFRIRHLLTRKNPIATPASKKDLSSSARARCSARRSRLPAPRSASTTAAAMCLAVQRPTPWISLSVAPVFLTVLGESMLEDPGGRPVFTGSADPIAPNQTYSFTWDGKDAYGRIVQGRQPVNVRIGYEYPAVYDAPKPLNSSFGSSADAITITRPFRPAKHHPLAGVEGVCRDLAFPLSRPGGV